MIITSPDCFLRGSEGAVTGALGEDCEERKGVGVGDGLV